MTKEQNSILLNLNQKDVEELEKRADVEVEDSKEVHFDSSIPSGSMCFDDVEMEEVMAKEYPDMYTQFNTNNGIQIFTTGHYETSEECLRNKKENSKGKENE